MRDNARKRIEWLDGAPNDRGVRTMRGSQRARRHFRHILSVAISLYSTRGNAGSDRCHAENLRYCRYKTRRYLCGSSSSRSLRRKVRSPLDSRSREFALLENLLPIDRLGLWRSWSFIIESGDRQHKSSHSEIDARTRARSISMHDDIGYFLILPLYASCLPYLT